MKHSGYSDGPRTRQVPRPYGVPGAAGHFTTRDTSEKGPSQVFGEILPSSLVKRKDHAYAYPDLRKPGSVEAAVRRASQNARKLTQRSGIDWNFRELPTMTLDRTIPVSLCLNMPDPLALQSIVSNALQDYRGRHCGLWVTLADDDKRKVLSLAVAPEKTDHVFVFWGFCSPLVHVNVFQAMQRLDMVPCMLAKRTPFYGIQFVRNCKFISWDSRRGSFCYTPYHNILGYQPSNPPPSKEYTREHVQCDAISAKAALLLVEQMGFQSPSMSKDQKEWIEKQDREYLEKNGLCELFAPPGKQGEIHTLEQLHAAVACSPLLDAEERSDEEVSEEKEEKKLVTSGQTAGSCGAHATRDVGEWSDEEEIEHERQQQPPTAAAPTAAVAAACNRSPRRIGGTNDQGYWSD